MARALGVSSESFRAVTGFAGIAAGAIVGATAAVVALGQRGAVVDDVRSAFNGLTDAAGSSADVMLGALRSGTVGTISDFDLMSMANRALGSGLIKTAADMETATAGARLLGKATGTDTAQAFETLITSISSGRTTQLRQLGLFVDAKVATENFATSLGKSVGDLTDAERAQALSAATLEALRGKLGESGAGAADFGEMIDQGKVAVKNFTDNLSVAVATSPVVQAGMNAMGSALQAAFGGSQQDTVKTLMGFVNDFAIGLTYVAQVGITAATVIVTAWSAIQTVVLGVITAVVGTGTAIVALVGGLAELGTKIPGIGSSVEGFAAGAKALGSALEETTLGMAAQTAEAARGVTGNSDLHRTLDELGGVVLAARDAMEAAGGATAGMTAKAIEARQPLVDVGIEARTVAMGLGDMFEAIGEQSQAIVDTATQASEIYTQVQNAITLANSTGIQQRLLEQDIARQAELVKLQELLVLYPEIYEEIAAGVTEKYRIMGQAAQGFHTSIVVQAGMAGFRTRAELELTAANAIDTYERMKDSGKFTAEEIRKAWEKAEEAKRAATAATSSFTISSVGEMLTATSGALQAFGVSYKAAAVAGAVLSSISAIQKAWASAPFPANLPAVGIVTAATVTNINRIRSSGPGFATGTLGTRFEDFGRGSMELLHGREAVVTPKQGASVAGMVEEELKARDTRTLDELRGLREDMADRDRRLPILLRDAALLAGA